MTADSIACTNHPDVTRQVLACRFCDAPVCLKCREPRPLAGSGITIHVCNGCITKEVRAKRARMALVVAVIAMVVAVVASTSLGPMYGLMSLAISGGFLYLSWRRYSTGTANLWDALRVGSIVSRFLR